MKFVVLLFYSFIFLNQPSGWMTNFLFFFFVFCVYESSFKFKNLLIVFSNLSSFNVFLVF